MWVQNTTSPYGYGHGQRVWIANFEDSWKILYVGLPHIEVGPSATQYQLIFAGGNSGGSFGRIQHDPAQGHYANGTDQASPITGGHDFRIMINMAVSQGLITQAEGDQLYRIATTRGATTAFTSSERAAAQATFGKMMTADNLKAYVDRLDVMAAQEYATQTSYLLSSAYDRIAAYRSQQGASGTLSPIFGDPLFYDARNFAAVTVAYLLGNQGNGIAPDLETFFAGDRAITIHGVTFQPTTTGRTVDDVKNLLRAFGKNESDIQKLVDASHDPNLNGALFGVLDPGSVQLASSDWVLGPGADGLITVQTASSPIVYQVSTSMILGDALGSAIGRYIGDGNPLAEIAGASILKTLGARLGLMIDKSIANHTGTILVGSDGLALDLSKEVSVDFWNNLQGQAVGTLSSYLAAEMGQALHLNGIGGEVFETLASSALQDVIGHLADGPTGMFAGLDPKTFFATQPSGVGVGVSALSAFLGAKLGSLIVQPQNPVAGVLSSGLSSAGSIILSAAVAQAASGQVVAGVVGNFASSLVARFGATWGNIIAPGIGAFVGYVIGALIGNLFGHQKPRVPTASAEVTLDAPNAHYELGSITASDGGNRELVTTMANTAKNTLNGIIGQVVGVVDPAFVANTYNPQQIYGHTGSQLYVKLGGSKVNVNSADEAVEKGVLWALPFTQIVGGDMFLKRALQTQAVNIADLGGNLQVANDYVLYLHNRDVINQAIAQPYESLSATDKAFYEANQQFMTRALTKDAAPLTGTDLSFYAANQAQVDRITQQLTLSSFAAGWMITLERASELNLDKFQYSDFYGGLRGFLDSFDLPGAGAHYEDVQLTDEAGGLRVGFGPSVTTGVFTYMPTSSIDGLSLLVTDFGQTSGFEAWTGQNTAGWDYANFSGVSTGVVVEDLHWETIYEPDPNDPYGNPRETNIGVSGGSDLFLGGAGADTLSGYEGWDWLDGGGGDDVIDGGADFDVLLGGAGRDRLLGGAGNDYLAGGDGDDRTASGVTAGLYGGDGNDTLVGGAGQDALYGENGDDILVIDNDGGAVADTLDGGAGVDLVSFERFASGVTATLGSSLNGDTLIAIEGIVGTALDDQLTGDALANTLRGGAGNDTLTGDSGDDVLEGGLGADALVGGSGIDTASYRYAGGGVWVDLTTGKNDGADAAGDTFSGVENLRGSVFGDLLKGDGGANRLEGLDGDDWFEATAGADVYDGGAGFDTVNFADATAGVTLNLGSTTVTSFTNGSGSGGLAVGQTFSQIEAVIGSAFADSITAGAGDHVIDAGAGNDTLAGGAGDDTYWFDRGGGSDTITETNADSNTLSFGEGVTFDDLYFTVSGGSLGYFDIGIRGTTTDKVRVTGNFAAAGKNRLSYITLGGGPSLDVFKLEAMVAGATSAANTLTGTNTKADLIVGFEGNDILRGAGASQVESKGNLIIGGLGDDTIYTSNGDDQFAFERGDGVDTITDTGGEDVIVFGSTATADDIIYEVVGSDLYVGLRDLADDSLSASQVADHLRIVGGGVINEDLDTGGRSQNTVEFLNAGGAWIDMRKLDVDWTINYYHSYGGGGGGGVIPPIVFDLADDGLDLTSVHDSQVVTRLNSGALLRTGWVGPTDGILAFDRNGDGEINQVAEIAFVQDKPGATSDLEGLAAWDTNQDGVLNALDAHWGDLRIWVDRNQNGRSTASELQTLEAAGISSIDLAGHPTGYTEALGNDSFVTNETTFTRTDGSTGAAYDVALARELLARDLTLEEQQAAWGSAAPLEGELGRLSEEPSVSPPQGARVASRWTPDTFAAVENGDEPGMEITPDLNRGASADFSDNDVMHAEDAARWARQLAGEGDTPGLDQDGVFVDTASSVKTLGASGSASAKLPSGLDAGLAGDKADLAVQSAPEQILWSENPAGGEASLLDWAASTLAAGSGHAGLSTARPWTLAYGREEQWFDSISDVDPRELAPGGAWFLTGLDGASPTASQAVRCPEPTSKSHGWLDGQSATAPAEEQKLRHALAGFLGRGAAGVAPIWRRTDRADRTELAKPSADWRTRHAGELV